MVARVAFAIVMMVAAGCAKEKPAVDWSKVPDTATSGNVELKIGEVIRVVDPEHAFLGDIVRRLGQPTSHILIHTTNTSKTQNLRFTSWDGGVLVEDENGNSYRVASVNEKEQLFYPGKPSATGLFIERLGPDVRECRITLPAARIGGEGLVRLRAKVGK